MHHWFEDWDSPEDSAEDPVDEKPFDLWVDFNSMEILRTAVPTFSKALITSTTTHANRPVSVDDEVWVGDGEGNRCRAKVINIRAALIDLLLDPRTFEKGDSR